jgi:hypothetical protein
MGNRISHRPSSEEIIIKTAIRFTILATQSREIYNEFTLRDDINIVKHIKFNTNLVALACLQKSPVIIQPNRNFGQFSACKRIADAIELYRSNHHYALLLDFALGFQPFWNALCGVITEDQLMNFAIEIRNNSNHHIAKSSGHKTFNKLTMVKLQPVEIKSWVS